MVKNIFTQTGFGAISRVNQPITLRSKENRTSARKRPSVPCDGTLKQIEAFFARCTQEWRSIFACWSICMLDGMVENHCKDVNSARKELHVAFSLLFYEFNNFLCTLKNNNLNFTTVVRMFPTMCIYLYCKVQTEENEVLRI